MSQIHLALSKLAMSMNKEGARKSVAIGDDLIDSDIKDSVSTGCTPLDVILSSPSNPNGGLPFGRVIEVYGAESEGKTTFSESVIVRTQMKGGFCILILTEGTIDKKRLVRQGADLGKIITIEPDTVEEGFDKQAEILESIEKAYETVEAAKKKAASGTKKKPVDPGTRALASLYGLPCISVWDTLSQCTTDADGSGMADLARAIRRKIRQHKTMFSKFHVLFVVVSQIYDSLNPYSPGVKTPGGRGIKHWSTARFELKRKGYIDGADGYRAGIDVELNIVKSKMCMPYRKVIIPMLFDTGINDDMAMYRFLSDREQCFHSAGGWHYIRMPDGSERNFHYAELSSIMDEPGVRDYVRAECWKLKGWGSVVTPPPPVPVPAVEPVPVGPTEPVREPDSNGAAVGPERLSTTLDDTSCKAVDPSGDVESPVVSSVELVYGCMGVVAVASSDYPNARKGSPTGDAKDHKMREGANGAIVELSKKAFNTPSSSNTTLKMLGQATDASTIVVVARNASLRGTHLSGPTKEATDRVAQQPNFVEFRVGDMPGVDEQFIDYFKKKQYRFRMYYVANTGNRLSEAVVVGDGKV